MQKQHIQLEEIIYEITGACKNGCTYCGSKDQWNEAICEDKIRKIAEAIGRSDCTPSAIDISGGDPLLVSYETHEFIVEEFKSVEISPKILCNPKSLYNTANSANPHTAFDILKLYDWVGLSINTEDDLQLFDSWKYQLSGINYTIITNFNLENIFIYDEIEEIVTTNNVMWQIQYTVYEKDNDPLAIYNNEPAKRKLFDKINNSISNGVKLVVADNMNSGKCGAGMTTIGILSDGTVVPCLSMRSWSDIKAVSQGNILKEGLDRIWETKFTNYRFQNFKCCKDQCKNKCFYNDPSSTIIDNDKSTLEKITDWVEEIHHPRQKIKLTEDNHTYVYGVQIPNNQPQICMYAVFTPDLNGNHWTPNSVTTTNVNPADTTYYGVADEIDMER